MIALLIIFFISGENLSSILFLWAISWNKEISFITRSKVKLMSRLPFKMNWLSVWWTKEFTDKIFIASQTVHRSKFSNFIVVCASQHATRWVMAQKFFITFSVEAVASTPVYKAFSQKWKELALFSQTLSVHNRQMYQYSQFLLCDTLPT